MVKNKIKELKISDIKGNLPNGVYNLKLNINEIPKKDGEEIVLLKDREKRTEAIIKRLGEGVYTISNKKMAEPKYKITFQGNIKILYHNKRLNNKIDAEFYAHDFFGKLGWKVFKSTSYFKRKENKNILKKINIKGMPDLIAFKKNKRIFIEVKTGQDGLRGDQIKWVVEHPQHDIILFYLNQKIKKNG